MSTIRPQQWLPAFSGGISEGGGGRARLSPAHIVVVASALRLGHVIHLRCAARLHLLICPQSPQEDYHFHNLDSISGVSSARKYALKRHHLLKRLDDAFSASCSSCFSFFSGNDSEESYPDRHKSQFERTEERRFHGRSWTNVILALNVLVYVAQVASQGKITLWGAKVNSLIDKGQLWRLVTSSFLHANMGHLLYTLLQRLQVKTRKPAFDGSLMSYRYCQSPAVGASGAIFGLVGSLAVFTLKHKNLLGGGKQYLQQIARVIALNMAIGLVSRGIDNWGHVGGLLGGAAMSWFLGPAWKYEFQYKDGRSVLVDRPPIHYFIRRGSL